MKGNSLSFLRVRRSIGAPHHGKLIVAGRALPCALGRSGLTWHKREGDGATPCGRHDLLRLFFDPRAGRPRSHLPLWATKPTMGWCDDPGHRRYNRLVELPFPASHETMRHDDGLYAMVAEIDWNVRPAIKGRGSAIFMHVARPGFQPTEGCVALRPRDLRWLAARLGPRTVLDIR